MGFSLSYQDISLFFAITAIFLLLFSEIISSYQGSSSILINKQRLRDMALFVSMVFLITVVIRIYHLITQP